MTYLFIWNGNPAYWPTRDENIAQFRKDGGIALRWSTKAHRQIEENVSKYGEVRALLFRSGKDRESQGILGFGAIQTPPVQGQDFDMERADHVWYAEINFRSLGLEPIVSRKRLEAIAPNSFRRLPMCSGRLLKDQADLKLVWDLLEPLSR